MRLVGVAFGAAVLAAGFALPAAAEPMDGPTLEATFSGMSFLGIYEDGAWFSEIYAPDGSISYVDNAVGHHFGNWEVRGNTFCTEYVDLEGVCLTAEQTSANCYFFAPPPPAKGREPVDTGTVIGWNALEPSTCESVPSVADAPPPPRTK
jgi:hypothetical protein